jgi:hypothetical protein
VKHGVDVDVVSIVCTVLGGSIVIKFLDSVCELDTVLLTRSGER